MRLQWFLDTLPVLQHQKPSVLWLNGGSSGWWRQQWGLMNVHLLTLAYFSIQVHSQHPCHCYPPFSSHLPSFRPSANLFIAAPIFLLRTGWAHCLKDLPTAFPHFCWPRSSLSFQGCSLPKLSSLSPGKMTSCLSGPLVYEW